MNMQSPSSCVAEEAKAVSLQPLHIRMGCSRSSLHIHDLPEVCPVA